MKTVFVTKAQLEHLHKLEGEQMKGDTDSEVCQDILERKAVLYEELKAIGKGINAVIPNGNDEQLDDAVNSLKESEVE